MRKLERYITVGDKRMRCGYTTGTCAAAATRAAMELLAWERESDEVVVRTPAGVDVAVEIEERELGCTWASCAVRKDAGDDPDVTDGALVRVRVEWSEEPGIRIEGGTGVGRVTRPGLDQPVGAAAINSGPRQMIIDQVESVLDASDGARRGMPCSSASRFADAPAGRLEPSRGCVRRSSFGLPAVGVRSGETAGVLVTVSVPKGKELAARTFNPRLGIEGGISIIGTSGIVRPMSEEAIIESVRLEIRQRVAEGYSKLVIVPGNYGLEFASVELGIAPEAPVQCSNYIGEALDYALEQGFDDILVVGHIGKMSKVARGAFNTHSRMGDGRMEAIAEQARRAGATAGVQAGVMACATTDAALDVLDEAGLLDACMELLVERIAANMRKRASADARIDVVVFSKVRGLLGRTGG